MQVPGKRKIRIGLNSRPVVAGITGKKKFLNDLWGDSVNTASRMESYGLPGEILITEGTCKIVKDRYVFRERGIINVKGKDEINTYFLDKKI